MDNIDNCQDFLNKLFRTLTIPISTLNDLISYLKYMNIVIILNNISKILKYD